MKSVKATIKKDPNLSSYTNFANSIKGKNFSRPIILRNFNKLVEKGDYRVSEKTSIIDYLATL